MWRVVHFVDCGKQGRVEPTNISSLQSTAVKFYKELNSQFYTESKLHKILQRIEFLILHGF